MDQSNPGEAGEQLSPPEKVEIQELTAEIYPDNRRVKVFFKLTPFQQNPSAIISLLNQEKESLASVSIINIFTVENEITLHVPAGKNTPGEYTIHLELIMVQEEPRDDAEPGQVKLTQTSLKTGSTTYWIK